MWRCWRSWRCWRLPGSHSGSQPTDSPASHPQHRGSVGPLHWAGPGPSQSIVWDDQWGTRTRHPGDHCQILPPTRQSWGRRAPSATAWAGCSPGPSQWQPRRPPCPGCGRTPWLGTSWAWNVHRNNTQRLPGGKLRGRMSVRRWRPHYRWWGGGCWWGGEDCWDCNTWLQAGGYNHSVSTGQDDVTGVVLTLSAQFIRGKPDITIIFGSNLLTFMKSQFHQLSPEKCQQISNWQGRGFHLKMFAESEWYLDRISVCLVVDTVGGLVRDGNIWQLQDQNLDLELCSPDRNILWQVKMISLNQIRHFDL